MTIIDIGNTPNEALFADKYFIDIFIVSFEQYIDIP